MRVTHLRCEYLDNPLGLDVRQPRLSWRLESNRRGERQTAYRILVASDPARLSAGQGDLWDTGCVLSEQSIHIEYAGQPLASRQRCWWSVQAWNRDGQASAWSAPAWWEMGLFEAHDWQAAWIGPLDWERPSVGKSDPAVYLRKEQRLQGEVRSARAYICGLGFYELWINGRRVGDQVLSPLQTDYDKRDLARRRLLYPFDDQTSQRAFYVTHDVSEHLRAGENAIGVILGNGWYNQRERQIEGQMWYGQPRLLLQIEVRYADGRWETLTSDPSWKMTLAGPLVHNSIFSGEHYDARLEMHGWDAVGYDDAAWQAAPLSKVPSGARRAQYGVPDRVTQTRLPIAIERRADGAYRLDYGQVLTGWVRLKVQGPRGRLLSLRFVENDERSYGQHDLYVCKGEGLEVWEPRFTWHGFRYVDVLGLDEVPRAEQFECRVVHTDIASAGRFRCANPLLERINRNFRWTQRTNMHGNIQSDCPHRERLAYPLDGQSSSLGAIANFQMAPFYTKWLGDIALAQNKNTGSIPHTAPFMGGAGGISGQVGYLLFAWYMYLYYGDRRILAEHYAGMQRWLEYCRTCTDERGVIVREEPGSYCLGDWMTPNWKYDRQNAFNMAIPMELVNTCYYAYGARLVARMAEILDKPDDAARYARLAGQVDEVVNRVWYDAGRKQYSAGREGTEVFPLAFGVAPEQERASIVQRLVDHLTHDTNYHFDTGMLGTSLLLDVLTEAGHGDVAYKLMAQTDHPSFGYPISLGATTLWEQWRGGSYNHPAFGGACRWFFDGLAGIRPDPARPGYQHFFIKPAMEAGLDWAEAEYVSPWGPIRSAWRTTGHGFRLEVRIPANTTATVHVRTNAPLTESGRPLDVTEGVITCRVEGGRTILELGSGEYAFAGTMTV